MQRKIEEIKRYRRRFYDNRPSVYDRSWWGSDESSDEMMRFKNFVKVKPGRLSGMLPRAQGFS